MRDFSEPTDMSDDYSILTTKVCPQCEKEFYPSRSNQKYCGSNCQKKSSRNSSRTDRTHENQKSSELHYDRAKRLEEMIYQTSPDLRYGEMKHILSYVDHDAGLRRILTDPILLKETPRKSGRKNIAQAASAYTKMFYGVSIKTYIQQLGNGTLNEEFVPIRVEEPRFKHQSTGTTKKLIYKPCEILEEQACQKKRFEADMQRITRVVNKVQKRVDALNAAGAASSSPP